MLSAAACMGNGGSSHFVQPQEAPVNGVDLGAMPPVPNGRADTVANRAASVKNCILAVGSRIERVWSDRGRDISVCSSPESNGWERCLLI